MEAEKTSPAEITEITPDDPQARRQKRIMQAVLNSALAKKKCDNCSTVGMWKIYGRERPQGRVRYIKCLGCGKPDQLPVIIKEDSNENEQI